MSADKDQILSSGAAEAVQEDAVLRVHAVLGLLKHHALRALHHGVGGLDATLGRKAVQEQRILASRRHQLLVHLRGDRAGKHHRGMAEISML